MKISVIVPTLNRQACLPNVVRMFKAQSWVNKELLIYDDSAQPALQLQQSLIGDTSVRYVHLTTPLSLGLKLNQLIADATGEVIMKWDDDDYYTPRYGETMLRHLGEHDFVKLSHWYAWSPKDQFFGYCETSSASSAHYRLAPREPVMLVAGSGFTPLQLDSFRWGYGFTYVFRKSVYPKARFNDQNWCSDIEFYKQLRQAGFRLHCVPDEVGLVLHIIHNENLSSIFPQYRLPEFLLTSVFGSEVLALGSLFSGHSPRGGSV